MYTKKSDLAPRKHTATLGFDRDLTKQIRQSLVKDKSLSRYAHNVKIVAQNGAVTLKGPVRSDEEKSVIEQKAAEIVGKDKVIVELEVKPKH